ncbi:mechanosensitive ion channel domain-containing protein, partial [Acinetobacter baumannii]
MCETELSRSNRVLIPLVTKLIRGLVVVAGLLIGLTAFGVNVLGVITGLGIGGLIVALAAKDSVENIFGSITILVDMPFALGDIIKVSG